MVEWTASNCGEYKSMVNRENPLKQTHGSGNNKRYPHDMQSILILSGHLGILFPVDILHNTTYYTE